MEEPTWSDNDYPAIDYQAYSYYSAPRQKEKKGSLEEVDPELLATFDKLGIPLAEQKRLANVAVDAVFDSVSIATTFREELGKAGVIFCSISEAVREYPDLIRKHLGSVVRLGSRLGELSWVGGKRVCDCACVYHHDDWAGAGSLIHVLSPLALLQSLCPGPFDTPLLLAQTWLPCP